MAVDTSRYCSPVETGARAVRRRRLLAPEVIQTSAMDCGPAALASVAAGLGVPIPYGRLRELCQTDVDGTSIDALEEIACGLGLDAEQIMVPVDHLLLDEAAALPAIVVVRLPDGATHFVVVWRRVAGFVQVMDPASGRVWIKADRFVDDVYRLAFAVPADAWREWAGTAEFLGPLRRRLRSLGVSGAAAEAAVEAALSAPGWVPLARLDAATRFVADVAAAGGVRPGRRAAGLLTTLDRAAADDVATLPAGSWSVTPAGADGEVVLHGAVLVRFRPVANGEADAGPAPPEAEDVEEEGAGSAQGDRLGASTPALTRVAATRPASAAREVARFVTRHGLVLPAVVAAGVAITAAVRVVESLLLRDVFDAAVGADSTGERALVVGALVVVLALLVAAEIPSERGVLRIGRRLELDVRAALLARIPRLGDAYFRSRPTSDMAERAHSAHVLRTVPELGARVLRSGVEIVVFTIGLCALYPAGAPAVVGLAVASVAVPLLAQKPVAERDLRWRTHAGALGRFLLDALLGLVPVRSHGAEGAVRSEHGRLLSAWGDAGRSVGRAAVWADASIAAVGLLLAAVVVVGYLQAPASAGTALLVVFWTLAVPAIGQQLAVDLRRWPALRSVTLRLLEPLQAPTETDADADAAPAAPTGWPLGSGPGMAVHFESTTVQAGGRVVLADVALDVRPGERIGVVGPSGAGKSTLVGVLLGWLTPARGRVRVDGFELNGDRLDAVRRETAWVDPAVRLWNRSLAANLQYGTSAAVPVTELVTAARLDAVVARLPDGAATVIGEGGGLLSGGEGQRVRLGRAMGRRTARLVLLDEAFRGLERTQREELLDAALAWWPEATFFCVTHDVADTTRLDRVVVLDAGRVVETGAPAELAARLGSRYRAMLDAESEVAARRWSGHLWRRARMDGGRLVEMETTS